MIYLPNFWKLAISKSPVVITLEDVFTFIFCISDSHQYETQNTLNINHFQTTTIPPLPLDSNQNQQILNEGSLLPHTN
jgi:hypothetical protein